MLTRDAVNNFRLADSTGKVFGWRGHVELLIYQEKMKNHEKDAALTSWNAPYQKGRPFKVMVCTSAFGTGVDAPDVRSVTVVGLTRSLLELSQVLGRIGRDGKAGRLHLIYSRFWENVCDHNGKLSGTNTILLSETVEWIKDSSSCRATRLDRYLGSAGDSSPCGERSTPVEMWDVCAVLTKIGGTLTWGMC